MQPLPGQNLRSRVSKGSCWYPEGPLSTAAPWRQGCCCSEPLAAARLPPGGRIRLQLHFPAAGILPLLWALTQNMHGCISRFLKIISLLTTTDSKNHSFRYYFFPQKLCSKITVFHIIKFSTLVNSNIPLQVYICLLSSTKHFLSIKVKKERKASRMVENCVSHWSFRDRHVKGRGIREMQGKVTYMWKSGTSRARVRTHTHTHKHTHTP